MSKKDKRLIDQAEDLHYTQWFDIIDLERQAESEEARHCLENIRRRKFHCEEYHAGVL